MVDDNRELVNLMEEYLLEQKDIEVVGIAYNGKECMDNVEELAPDVIVLDIIMPHIDGLAVLSKLKQNDKTKHINIIMLTAFGQEEVTKKAVDLGGRLILY
ncbi:stage 0 sporulation two-component response regulator [Gracilibacillus boraciitolerans JCM 21714]|uniref:Stage 0 sporulation two-component response regulator n=1 Tax=Gracilibacillus boraciitolerans JCM 21714 TaxID=1298598 RepID=W4VDH2_9BACI|nr:stage 0 sporulation two-component response regulator [Gracilibacillus boraciitolerans JCM 21714]